MHLISIRLEPHVLRTLTQKQIDGTKHKKDEKTKHPAGRPPSGLFDQVLHPWQQHDRSDTDACECNADGEPAPPHEPVGQEQGLSGIAETDAAATDQHADRQIQMPGLRGQRRQQQAARHQDHAQFHDGSRTEAIHHPSHQGTHYARDQKSERECAGGDATLPMEFVDDGRK